MPGLISVPNFGSFKNKENTGSRMGHANKKYEKNNSHSIKMIIIGSFMTGNR
jgi:hypothetical protein